MAKRRQAPDPKRRTPQQARANQTAAAILEGAAQILEAGGLAAFTTNAVAERAGVSIGTLYQYFADKDAVLLALAKQEMAAALAEIGRTLQAEAHREPGSRLHAMVRVMVNAFRGRVRARKAVMEAILAQGAASELMGPVMAFIASEGARVGHAPQPIFATLSAEQLFVLSRGMMGVIRAAVMEEQPFFTSKLFEDEVVRLVMAYLAAVTADGHRTAADPTAPAAAR
jgi:AcrR family transcriptional regulator